MHLLVKTVKSHRVYKRRKWLSRPARLRKISICYLYSGFFRVLIFCARYRLQRASREKHHARLQLWPSPGLCWRNDSNWLPVQTEISSGSRERHFWSLSHATAQVNNGDSAVCSIGRSHFCANAG